MNAGAYGYEIKDVLCKIKIVNEDGKIIELASGEVEKKYRHGGVPENSSVTEAWFQAYARRRRRNKGPRVGIYKQEKGHPSP